MLQFNGVTTPLTDAACATPIDGYACMYKEVT